ncbi:hypothetical protein HJC23_009988 [Cyclotella cryptica]|uniref:Uncharacterized protein n=1 Tax=Cyclotella cryptica TaxID=29204 RepID=A0ABD3Q8F5_9STRA
MESELMTTKNRRSTMKSKAIFCNSAVKSQIAPLRLGFDVDAVDFLFEGLKQSRSCLITSMTTPEYQPSGYGGSGGHLIATSSPILK